MRTNVVDEIHFIQKRSWFLNINVVRNKKDGFFIYWRYRVLRPLIKLQYKTFRFFNRPAPWLSPAAIIFFKKHLTKEMAVAEFGSGFSTLFIAPKVKQLVSVEHNKTWHKLVCDKIKMMNISNVDYKYIPQEEPKVQDKPLFLKDFDIDEYEYDYRQDYVAYFSALNEYPDEHFDIIIVDGRARPECVFSSYKKLKNGGLMILDNSERERYKIVFEMLNHLESTTTTNGLTNTTFWQKI